MDWYVEGTGSFVGQMATDPGTQFIETYRNYEDIGGGWIRETLAFDLIPQPGIEEWHFVFDPGTNGSAFMDNFHFGTHCVPEPASLAALGLGGFVLLRRRVK